MRYTAYTLDGSPIFRAKDAQELADKVFTHLQESRKPHIGYTYAYDEWYPGAYKTWQMRHTLVGYPHGSFSEVAGWWKGRHTSNVRVWRSGPPPAIGWWNASFNRSNDAWRWWDGNCWSLPAYPDYSADQAAAAAAQSRVKSHKHEVPLWNDYWPENAACTPWRKP